MIELRQIWQIEGTLGTPEYAQPTQHKYDVGVESGRDRTQLVYKDSLTTEHTFITKEEIEDKIRDSLGLSEAIFTLVQTAEEYKEAMEFDGDLSIFCRGVVIPDDTFTTAVNSNKKIYLDGTNGITFDDSIVYLNNFIYFPTGTSPIDISIEFFGTFGFNSSLESVTITTDIVTNSKNYNINFQQRSFLLNHNAYITSNTILYSNGEDYSIAYGALTGLMGAVKSLNSVGNLSVNTNKFFVTASTGDTSIAGVLSVNSAINGASYSGGAISGTSGNFTSSLSCVGNLAVNTNKFNVNATNGNTTTAGTLGATGAITGASYSGGAISGTTGTFSSDLNVTGRSVVQTEGASGFYASSIRNTGVGGRGLEVSTLDGVNIFIGVANSVMKYLFTDTLTYMVPVYTATTSDPANVSVDSVGRLRRSTSSRKYKENERLLEMDTSKIYDVEIKTFEMKESGKTAHGAIAEDIALIEPNFATYDEEGAPNAIHNNNLIYSIIVEMKALKNTIFTLEQRIKTLEGV